MGYRNYLFSQYDAHSVQASQRKQMQGEISSMDGDRLLNTNVDDLVAYFADKYGIEIPELLEESVDQREAQRDVSGDPLRTSHHFGHGGPLMGTGTEISVDVPFSGVPKMFEVRPSTFSSNPPQGVARGSTLTFSLWSDTPNADQIRGQIQTWLSNIRQHLQWQREGFRELNEGLPREARQAIEGRRKRLLENHNLVAALGIPLKLREDARSTYIAPEIKRKIAPRLPSATTGPYKSEPILEEAEYQHILGVIESMVKVMERSPKAFHGLDEESIRSHFLVHLNGHYEGQATGETFNYEGKTDILIRSGDRNIFIAECKFWGGPSNLGETIDQLLGYLSWRDSKAAILLFNRNREFSRVLGAIPQAHPGFRTDEGKRGETGFRYAFRHKDDPAKLLHLTVLAFDMPRPPE
jgi:hypothetical protein